MAEEFDPLRYIASYPDLIQAFGADAEAGRQHWLTYGQAEGRNPFLFNPFIYGASHPDLIAAFGTNYAAYTTHYIRYGFAEGRATSSFDYLGYSASNYDLLVVFGTDPTALARHYLEFGYSEGRSFDRVDALLYAASNPDVAAAYGEDRVQILTHFINHGFYERRPTAGFDPIQYVAANEDLLLLGYQNYPQDALHHYLQTGADEGRPTNFDEQAYLLTYADLAGIHMTHPDALNHWMTVGVHEGRVGDTLFGHDQAYHLLVQGVANAAIDFVGDRDWFEVNLDGSTPVHLMVSGPNGAGRPATITIHDQYGSPIASRSINQGDGTGYLFNAPYSGRFYVVVASNQTGSYQLGVEQLSGGTMTISGRNYTDADFAGLHNIRNLVQTDHYQVTLGPNAQAAGIRVVTATSNLGSVVDASAYTVGLTVDVKAGGPDVVITGSGNDVVLGGPGAQNISTGAGFDHVVAGNGAQLISLGADDDLVTGSFVTAQSIDGGDGIDTLRFSTVPVTIDLAKLTGIERIESVGDTILYLTASGPAFGSYEIARAASSPDNGVFIVEIMASVTSPDLSFNVTAPAGGQSPTLIKWNIGVLNEINYIGGPNKESLWIHAGDLVNVHFDGGAASDTLRIMGGVVTDANLVNIHNVESLTGHFDSNGADFTLGAEALRAGIQSVVLGGGSNHVVVLPTFDRPLDIRLARSVSGPNDTTTDYGASNFIDASAAGAPVTFTIGSPDLQANDTVLGSASSTDVLNINYRLYIGSQSHPEPIRVNLSNVSGVETINIFLEHASTRTVTSHRWITIDTAPSDLDGTDTLAINVIGPLLAPQLQLSAPIDASAATVNLLVNGANAVKGGSGDDVFVGPRTGAALFDGGAGNDSFTGGTQADGFDGGSGADIFHYLSIADSKGATRDTITGFASGSDVIDVTHIDDAGYEGQTIDFVGNAVDLAAAQALLTPRDTSFDAVFQQNNNTLWFDNGDGVLDANDIQIVLTGVVSLTGADVLEGSVIIG